MPGGGILDKRRYRMLDKRILDNSSQEADNGCWILDIG